MSHTQGKLRVAPASDYAGASINIDAGKNGYVGEIGQRGDPKAEADARRLVACWNACDGIPTEVLIAQPYINTASYCMRRAAEAQRDELLYAFRAFVTEARQHMPDHQDSPFVIAADRVIAKATS